MISKEQFLQDVAHEVESLKRFGTKKELAKLNIELFNPSEMDNCIYGQMTGSCDSDRAKKLMDKSCVRVTTPKSGFNGVLSSTKKSFDDVVSHINGSYEGQTWSRGFYRNYEYLSMLELYITLEGAKVGNIISYLKGEISELNLEL